jgi:uncharacterized repeat protein (TIGR01451 family)
MLNIRRILNVFLALALLAATLALPPAGHAAQPWQDKVDAWVLETAAQGQTEFLVYLAEQADLSGAAALKTKLEKGAYVFAQLTAVAGRTQPPVLAALHQLGADYRPYWIANMIWVRGGPAVVQAMAERRDVAKVFANPTIHMDLPVEMGGPAAPVTPNGVGTNITQTEAPQVWAAGYTGQGVVIAGQDTGYDWDHPALKSQYRGWNGLAANHNYNWHDAIHTTGSSCGANSPEPCDDHGHGTHTMGTMVGDDGLQNQIGMAPGARWIGCRNMNAGAGTPTTYTECYQFFIAPTDLAGANPNPALAPDVINNSWGCPASEGCNALSLLTVVQAVRAAGIITVHSAGNDGSSCNTINTPAGMYDESFTVGAVSSTDTIASFSSRGPSTYNSTNYLKPDISAPGVSIRSSYVGGGYTSMSGTSMAAPHVAGLVALMISAQPALAGQVDAIEDLLRQTALPRTTTTESCGGVPGTQVPNNTYGHGRIRAWEAYQHLHRFSVSKTAPAQAVPGEIITYTLTITHTHPSANTTGVVLTDTLPAGVSFVAATGSYTLTGRTVAWNIPDLAPGANTSVDLSVQIDPTYSGLLANHAYTAHSADVAPVSGPAAVTTVVPFSLLLGLSAPAQVLPGETFTYTLTITNPHPWAPVHDLVLTDTLPASVTFIAATSPYSLTGSTLRWELPTLAAGASWQVHLTVQVPLTAAGSIDHNLFGVSAREASAPGAPAATLILWQIFIPLISHLW